jgi:chromosome segregation ATPase
MKAPTPSPGPRPAVDLESTAELPVLDPAELEAESGTADDTEATDTAHSATDTWILPPGARVVPVHAPGRQAPPPVVDTPSEAELRQLEANLQTALTKLGDAEQLASQQLAKLRELEASRDEARSAHRTAEENAALLRAELAQRDAAGVRHADELDALVRARGEAEQRAASVDAALTRAQEKSSALSDQLAQLQQRLDQQQALTSSELVREREQQQALTAQAQAHSARLIQDLHLERARSASCLESLQTLESRRQIAESATIDLHREMDMWQSTEAELRGRLGGRDSRVRELETELDRRAAQIGALERQITSLESKLS